LLYHELCLGFRHGCGTRFDNAGVMVCDSPTCPTARLAPFTHRPAAAGERAETPRDDEGERDRDSDDVPETPLDEPPPPRVEEPPPQPDEKGPYLVSAG
jgi:hypothetical protein